MGLTAPAFDRWIKAAKAGQSVVYHRGFLARDTTDMSLPRDRRWEIGATAGTAWKAYEAGQVSLVQRHLGGGVYDYIAQRRAA